MTKIWPWTPAQRPHTLSNNPPDNRSNHYLGNNMDNTPPNNHYHPTDLLRGCPSLLSSPNHGAS